MIQDHAASIYTRKCAHEVRNVTAAKRLAYFTIEVAFDRARGVGYKTLIQSVTGLELFRPVLGQDDGLNVEIFQSGPQLANLVRRVLR